MPTSMIAERLHLFLQEHHIAHEVMEQPAGSGGVPPTLADDEDGAVPVTAWVLAIGEQYALLVLPTGQPPAIGLLNQRNTGRRIRLASEAEIRHLFPDCEPEAVPPCGELYGVPVYISDELAPAKVFFCVAGRTDTWLRLDRNAFERLAQPHWLALPPAGTDEHVF
ncbi:MAG: YbaK/EbsC family protein [Phycisphaeraceae bacterium]